MTDVWRQDTIRIVLMALMLIGVVLALGPAKAPLDLILLDPPYGSGAGAVALDRLRRLGWIGEGSWVVLETGYDEKVQVKLLTIESERKVGKGKLTLMRLAGPA